MTVSLTTEDLKGIRRGMRRLLAPLDHPTTDAWRSAVNRTLKPVLGADFVTFYLPGVEARPLYNEDIDDATLGAYPDYEMSVEQRFGLLQRMNELGVWTRPRVYGRDYEQVRRTAYWNEYIVPTRAFDALGLTVWPRGLSRPSTLFFHHERPTGPKFGERGYDLLRLAYPAFEAGTRMHVRLARRRQELARVLDELPDALMLVRADGTTSHCNAALGRLLAAEPEARRVRTAIAGVARAVVGAAGVGARRRRTEPVDPARSTRLLRTARATYRIVGVLGDPSLFDRGPTVLVSVSPSRPALPSAQAIRERHGLTPRESEVALLIARRRTNAEIAEALSISPHTARHHTESVMLKLGLGSRLDLEGVILDGADADAAGDGVG